MLLNACCGRCMHHPAVNTVCFNAEGSYSQHRLCTRGRRHLVYLRQILCSKDMGRGHPLHKRRALHTTMQASFLSSRPAHAASGASSASCWKLGAALPGLGWGCFSHTCPHGKNARLPSCCRWRAVRFAVASCVPSGAVALRGQARLPLHRSRARPRFAQAAPPRTPCATQAAVAHRQPHRQQRQGISGAPFCPLGGDHGQGFTLGGASLLQGALSLL